MPPTIPTPPASRPRAGVDPYSVGLFVLAVAWLRSFARYGMNWVDEGFALNAARRIAEGELLYRDFFSPYGPGRHYLLGGAFRLFGPDLMVARWTWLLVLAGAVVAAYRVGLRLVPRPWAVGASLYFLLVPPQLYKAFTPAAYLALVLATLRARERPTLARWLAAGAAVGVAGWFRFELWGAGGIVLLAGWGLAPAVRDAGERLRRLLAAGAGAVATIVPPAAVYAAAGLLPGIIGYERMQKQQLARFFTLPLPDPYAALAGAGSAGMRLAAAFDAVAGWIPLAACGAALLAGLPAARRGGERAASLGIVAVAGLLMQVAYVSRPDFDHLLHVTPVAFLVLAYFLRSAWVAASRPGTTALPVAAVTAAALFLAAFASSAIIRHPLEGFSIGRRWVASHRVALPAHGTYYDTEYQAAVTAGMRDLLTRNFRPAAFLKFGSFWYWAFDLPSPIPQDPLSTFSGAGGVPSAEEAVVEALRRAGIRYVFLEVPDPRYAILPPFEVIHPVLADYLQRDFQPTGVRIGEWLVLEARPPSALAPAVGGARFLRPDLVIRGRL